MSTALVAGHNTQGRTFAEKLTLLNLLPGQLASVSEHQVLRTAAEAVIQVFPEVNYLRILLVSKNHQPSEQLEWCSDKQLIVAMANIQPSSHTAQQAAMRQSTPIYTQQLTANNTKYEDWKVLSQQFGMQSFAAVPLMVAGTVYGVIMAAAPSPACFNPSSIELLETVAHMLSPYAAVLYRYQQVAANKSLLRQILPARVVDAAMERLEAGSMSAADMFHGVNQEFPPG